MLACSLMTVVRMRWSSAWRIGFCKITETPDIRPSSPSRSCPREVRIITRTGAISGSALIARAKSSPFRSGIFMSRMATS